MERQKENWRCIRGTRIELTWKLYVSEETHGPEARNFMRDKHPGHQAFGKGLSTRKASGESDHKGVEGNCRQTSDKK